MAEFDPTLLSRVEDASLNASAPPQQRWIDGWLLRFSPGKARRARCVHALAEGRLPLDEKLSLATQVYAEAGLPMVLRIHRFSQPAGIDEALAERGWARAGDTQVMLLPDLPVSPLPPPPPGLKWTELPAPAFAEAVGELRGSPTEQRLAHAERLAHSPVPYRGFAWCSEDGRVQACGQFAREGAFVGLYDVFTRPEARGQRLAGLLCERMLSVSVSEGAKIAYLQVEADNLPARRVYQRLGFRDGYGYHYRERA